MPSATTRSRPPLRDSLLSPLPPGSVRAAGLAGGIIKRHADLWRAALESEGQRGASITPSAMESLIYIERATGGELTPDAMRGADQLLSARQAVSPLSVESLYAQRAAMAYYKSFGDARALKAVLTGCADQIAAMKKAMPEEPAALAMWGDFVGIALEAYRCTGLAQLLPLARLWIRAGLDWTGWFHRFPQIQPMKRDMPYRQMTRLAAEESALIHDGMIPVYTQMSLAARGDMAAAGLRACMIKSVLTGSLKDEQAFAAGLEKLFKYHGVASGMFTCDAYLQGKDPSGAVWSAAASEMLRSLEMAQAMSGSADDIGVFADAAERIAYNFIPAYFADGGRYVRDAQRVNEIECSAISHAHYSLPDDASVFRRRSPIDPAISGLFGALPRFVSSQWMMTAHGGLAMMGYMPCEVRYRTGGAMIRLHVESDYPYGDEAIIRVSCKDSIDLPIDIRIPAWAGTTAITAPDGETVDCTKAGFARINKTLSDGDVIRIRYAMRPRIVEVGASALSVERGPIVYALPIEAERLGDASEAADAISYKAVSYWKETIAPGTVLRLIPAAAGGDSAPMVEAEIVRVPEWNVKKRIASAPPRDFITDMSSRSNRQLIPFADTALRIAQFPKL